MPTIEDAIALALQAHRGQVDRAGRPYILHPLRVMGLVDGMDAKIVAVLHDVVEDTPTTLDELRGLGYSERIVTAVNHLTRREDETYEQFIERIKPHPLARHVKLADLMDNMDLRRNNHLGDGDLERLRRYQAAWHVLHALDSP
jgi:(p)ppGpp synthase/HD superfamily hydrolase